MDMLENILSREVVHKLGWTLLHSLWQCGVVALLLVVLLRVLRKSSANLRYVIACLGLVVIVLLPIATFYIVPAPAPMPNVESIPGFSVPVTERPYKVYDTDIPLQRAAEYMHISHTISLKQRAMNYYATALPYIVFGWFIGVLSLCLWHFGGWVHLQRLKRKNVNRVDSSLKDKLHNLAKRLKVTRPVMLMESALVQIPTVVGWLRPVILLPASALTGLSPEQLEALLAHELSHIRRYDYLVNMFQTLVEILGFYHPAVWWISYKIRVERENCCDDLAVSVCGDKVGYARALASMEEIRVCQGELVIAASGGSLSRRIRRLIGTGSEKNIRFGYVPVVISILLVVALMIPTTLALTAKRENKDSNPVSATKSDSIKATDAFVVATDQKNDYERYSVVDLDETAAKEQILFECKIFEAPIDLKFLEGEHKEDGVNRIVWLGNEYAERLESLSQKTQKAKKLANPRLLVLEGEEASMDLVHRIAYKAGYESTSEGDTEPKPIFKYLFDGIKLKLKGHTVDSSAISTEIRLTQSKTGFTTHKDSQGREIQIPVVASSTCATDVVIPGNTPVVIGGLKSQNNDDSQLLLVITPSIIRMEKSPELAQIEKEVRAVDTDPGRVVEFPDDERIEAEKAVIQAQIEALEAQLIELRKNYEAEIFNRQSEWWAEMRAFTADVVAAQQRIVDANMVFENDLAVLKNMQREVDIFKIDNKANFGTDIALYNKLKTMEAKRDKLAEKIERDKGVLAKHEKELKEAVARREQYFKYRPRAGTDPNEAQRVINLAKKALELQLYELKGLSSEQASPKEAKSEGESRYHTVREGETLSSISNKYYGSESKWQEILNCNREIIAADGIRIGQKLVILPLKTSEKEAETEHERLAAMAAKCAERGDFTKAIEHLENAIELAKTEKDYGIGIAIARVDGLIRVDQVLPDSPASGSSFRKGDIIKAVDGISTEGMSLNEVVAGIRGPKETKVTLTVKCHSQEITMEKTFTRQLLLKGSPALQEYYRRLDAYEAGKTWPQYRRMMEEEKVQKAGTPRVFAIRYASAEELAEVLSRILERRWKGVKDRSTQAVRIIPEPNRNRLIVIASPDDIQLIEALIAELDVLAKRDTVAVALKAIPPTEVKQDAPVESTITKIIKLKHADCESVEQILIRILSDEHLKIATDKRTNVLIVAGTKSDIEEIRALVAEIDVAVPDKDINPEPPEESEEKEF